MLSDLAVAVVDEKLHDSAMELSARLGVPLLGEPDAVNEALETASVAQLLIVAEDGLSLQVCGHKRPGPVRADFLTGAVDHRRRFGGGKGQLVAKACGVKKGLCPQVVDLTAGLGRDAFVLATLGCNVTLVERHPVVHALLQDGLERARASDIGDIVSRMHLVDAPMPAWQWLEENSQPLQVLYCDPMFPHAKGKQAQVKKEMLAFRTLVGADNDSERLLAAALAADPARVVVKRARKAPVIDGAVPSHALEGKSSRYDIYARRRLDLE